MSDSNPKPENPYAATQVAQAEIVPAVDPAEMRPGELPCHQCGQPVPKEAVKCPRCWAKPLYDDLQLLLTAVLVFAVGMGVFLWTHSQKKEFNEPFPMIVMGVAIAVIMPTVKAVFTKLKGGRW